MPAELSHVQYFFNELPDRVGRKGFADIIPGPNPHGFHGRFQGTKGRRENNGRQAIVPRTARSETDAIHPRHFISDRDEIVTRKLLHLRLRELEVTYLPGNLRGTRPLPGTHNGRNIIVIDYENVDAKAGYNPHTRQHRRRDRLLGTRVTPFVIVPSHYFYHVVA